MIPAGQIAVEGEYFVGSGSDLVVSPVLSAQTTGFALAAAPVRVYPAIVPPVPVKRAAYVAPLPLYPQEKGSLLVVQAVDDSNILAILPGGPLRVTIDTLGALEMETPLQVPTGLEWGKSAAFAVGYLKAGPIPATSSISVTLPCLESTQVEVPLFKFGVTKPGLSFAFPTSVMGTKPSNFVVAQIHDIDGRSLPVSQPTELFLFSQDVDLPSVEVLHPGESFKAFPVTLNLEGAAFTVTALVPGMEPATVKSNVAAPALKIDVTINASSVAAGKTAEIKAEVTLSGSPVRGAT